MALVGFSMGSFVAHKVASDRPALVTELMLIGSAPTLAGSPDLDPLRAIVATFADSEPAPTDFVIDFNRDTFAPTVSETVLFRFVAEGLRLRGEVWKAALTSMGTDDHSADLVRITAKTRILYGQDDRIIPPVAQDVLRQLIPSATLVTYPGVGHMVHIEHQSAVIAEIERMLGVR